jgi:mRNA interferase RelE/StbE
MEIKITTAAAQELAALPAKQASQIARKIARLEQGLVGDIKQLVQHESAYRLRAGDYRILFDVENDAVVIKKIGHRKEIYD